MRLLVFPISAIIASWAMSFSVNAEDQSLSIEEVVVTARKQEESAQDIPISITALSAELKNSSIRNLSDITGYSPNVIFSEDGGRGGGGANITIRGISPTRSDDNSLDAPVAVVVDDIYLGTLAGQVMENFDLERVEVLRGPQGTLFGKNTVGGVINVIRSRPTGEFGGKFKLTSGNDGQLEFRGVLNTSLTDTLAAKFFYSDIRYDGFMSNSTTGNDVGDRDYQNYGVTFLWEPNDRFEALLTVEQFQDEGTLNSSQTNYNVAPGVLAAPPAGSPENDYSGGFLNCTVFGPVNGVDVCRTSLKTPSSSTNDKDNDYLLETDALTLKMSYQLNENMTLVSITGYRDVIEDRYLDFDSSAAPFITIDRDNVYTQKSQEFRLDGNWETVTLSAGVYWFESDFTQDWATGDGFWGFLFGAVVSDPALYAICNTGAFGAVRCDPGLTSIPLGTNVSQILYEDQVTTSYAAYAQADWQFAEDWTLTAGVRWTREEKDFIAGQSYLTTADREKLRNFPEYTPELKNEWTEVSPKVGLTYAINDDSIAFVTYSEGFHSGGFFGVNQNINDFVRDQYDPEYANTWEIGYKSQHLDNRLRFNLTYFRNEFEDKQESFVALDPTTKTVATVFDNAAEALYQGWELETQYVVNEYLRVFLNYGYLDAEYEDFETDINPNDGITLIEDASYLTPRSSPENTIGVGGTVTIPMANGAAIEIFAKFTRIDERENSLLNLTQARTDEVDDLSASIGYYTDDWSVVAFGRNLTDERFEVFAPIATLFAAGSVNKPRSYGVEFQYNF
jgi:iron complex outermembrane receptor protein